MLCLGAAGHYFHRGRVLGAGCLVWATTTTLFSFSTSLPVGAAIWAVNGVGLVRAVGDKQGAQPIRHSCGMAPGTGVLVHSRAAAVPTGWQPAVDDKVCMAVQALVIPNTQSLTADYFPASSRGKAFGTLWLTASLGGMAGSLYATNLGESSGGQLA